MNNPKILFRVHAVQRMFERNVSIRSVLKAIDRREILEDYSDEMPEPGCLLLGFQGKYPFHVVTSENSETRELIVITVYIPSPDKWKKDFRSRRA